MFDQSLAVGGRWREDGLHGLGRGRDVAGHAAGGAHDAGQAENLLAMAECHQLDDVPAHRGAHHVRPVDVEDAQQRRGVVGHVLQGVGRLLLPHGDVEHVGQAQVVELAGEPDVTVVETDHVERAGRGQLLAEVLVPGDHLDAQAHHEQEGRGARAAERVVFELHPVGLGSWHVAILAGP